VTLSSAEPSRKRRKGGGHHSNKNHRSLLASAQVKATTLPRKIRLSDAAPDGDAVILNTKAIPSSARFSTQKPLMQHPYRLPCGDMGRKINNESTLRYITNKCKTEMKTLHFVAKRCIPTSRPLGHQVAGRVGELTDRLRDAPVPRPVGAYTHSRKRRWSVPPWPCAEIRK
jgi:hypothetical protein